MFKLAPVQMLVEGGRPTENLRRAEEFSAQVAKTGTTVIMLPWALPLDRAAGANYRALAV